MPFNLGNVFVDVESLKSALASAQSQLAAANTRAAKLEEENAILKSDKIVLSDDIVKLKGDIATKDAQLSDHTAVVECLINTHKDITNANNARIAELEKNQKPARVNGRFVSSNPDKATKKVKPVTR